MVKSSRLFVGNIPKGTSEEELTAEFSAYGLVESIEIKTKPNSLTESLDTFGFVTLQADDQIVSQCLKEFREQKYKGVHLNVSKAKESFLDRLKRERKEAEVQKRVAVSLDPYKQPVKVNSGIDSTKQIPALPKLQTNDESSSSASSESESEEEVEHTNKSISTKQQAAKPQDEIVKKWNQETYIEHGKLKIIPITGQVKEIIDRSKSRQTRSGDKKLEGKARIADEKRKQGLTKLKSAYEQQKLAIKSALSNETLNSKRKIAFSDDVDESATKTKLSLFDAGDDHDDFEGNFKARNQLAGEEGKKLHEMQTAYQADSRFRLDSRFVDHADYKTKELQKSREKTNGIDKERLKQLEILSNVTGKQILAEKRGESKPFLHMQRFDPSQQDETGKNIEPAVRKDMFEIKKAERRDENFKVSEQKFYAVSENLVSLVGGASREKKENDAGFSLLTMFGRKSEGNRYEAGTIEDMDTTDKEKPLKSDARFKYESSDSEEENYKDRHHENDGRNESSPAKEYDDSWIDNVEQRRAGYYSKQGIWKENFFFLPNDARFDDGRKFFGIHSAPVQELATGIPDDDADKKKSDAKDIRKVFKKRRQREGKNMQVKSKLGFKVMRKKSIKKMN